MSILILTPPPPPPPGGRTANDQSRSFAEDFRQAREMLDQAEAEGGWRLQIVET